MPVLCYKRVRRGAARGNYFAWKMASWSAANITVIFVFVNRQNVMTILGILSGNC